MLGTKEKWKNFLPSSPTQNLRENKSRHFGCMLSLPIGCTKFLWSKAVCQDFGPGLDTPIIYKLGVLTYLWVLSCMRNGNGSVHYGKVETPQQVKIGNIPRSSSINSNSQCTATPGQNSGGPNERLQRYFDSLPLTPGGKAHNKWRMILILPQVNYLDLE
jgi:hypothetical protein